MKNWPHKNWQPALWAGGGVLCVFVSIFFVGLNFKLARPSALGSSISSMRVIEDVSLHRGASLASSIASWNLGRPLKLLQARTNLRAIQPSSLIDFESRSNDFK